jgi:hypothetical protein
LSALRSLSIVIASVAIATVSAIDCGGKVENGECPVDLALGCTSGDQCSTTTTVACGSPMTLTCSCVNGVWACPNIDPGSCSTCVGVSDGSACGHKGDTCTIQESKCKDARTITCTCDGQRFSCPPSPLCQTCPPSSAVTNGAACSMNGTTTCTGVTSYKNCDGTTESTSTTCRCMNGSFVCAEPFPPPCVADASVPD